MLRDEMKYHPLLSATFIRFLTKQTGQNVSAGVGGQLSALKSFVTTEIKKVDLKTNTNRTTLEKAVDKNKLINAMGKKHS